MKLKLITICLLLMFSGGLLEAKSKKNMKKAKRRPAAVDSHVDFDDLAIEGQNKKSSAFHFLERVSKEKDSKVRKRRNFRSEILESL